MEGVAESQKESVGCKDMAGFMCGKAEQPQVMLEFYVWEEGVGEVLLVALRHLSGMQVISSCKHLICRQE